MSIPVLRLKYDGLGQPRVAPADYFIGLQDAKRTELLTESIRFFDYRDREGSGTIKGDWPRLTVDIIDQAARAFRHGCNRSLQSLIHQLYIKDADEFIHYYKDEEQNYYLPFKKQSFTYNDPANKAKYATRIFISDLFRTERFIESRKQQKGRFQGIKLEQLPVKLSALRASVNELLGDATLTALPSEIVTQLRSGNEAPAAMLSEHLYIHAAAIPRQRGRTEYPQSVRKLRDAIDSLEIALSGLWRFNTGAIANSVFNAWQHALDVLEMEFILRGGPQAEKFGLGWGIVLASLLKAYLVELKVRVLVSSMPIFGFYNDYLFNSCIGVCLWEAISGKPLQTPSIPNMLDIEAPTDNQYRLKYPGQHQAQDEIYGFITREGPEQGALIGSLSGLQATAGANVLGLDSSGAPEGAGDRPSNTVEDLEVLLAAFLRRPIVKASFPPESKSRRLSEEDWARRPSGLVDRYVFEALTLEDFEKHAQHRNPVMLRGASQDVREETPHRPNYYAITGVNPNPVSIVNFGNTFFVQLLFYVSCHLLEKISDRFELGAFYQQQRAQADQSTVSNLRRELASLDTAKDNQYKLFLTKTLELQRLVEMNRFNLTAGSYLHGGSFPPHKTHRDGRHFDISMGPNLTPWRTTGLRQVLSDAWEYMNINPYADPKLLKGALRPRFKSTIYLCERSAADVGRQTLHLLDNEYMSKLVDEVTSKVVDAELEEAGGECYETESDAIGVQIQRLYGTPYSLSMDDAELGHLGTLCVVLSAPTRIIYASPIMILRCIRSLLRGVQQMNGSQMHLGDVGVTDSGKLDESVRSLFRCLDIGFLPSDHHHHWHLYYPSIHPDDSEKAKTKKDGACRKIEQMGPRLDALTPLWLLLDVDLQPFQLYAERYKLSHLVYQEIEEAKQLDAIISYCETYAQLRKLRLAREGAQAASRNFLYQISIPHVLNVREDLIDSPCFGNEIDEAASRPMAQAMAGRSNEIKAHLRAYRDELMRLYGLGHDVYAKELADKLAPFTEMDSNHEDSEGGQPGSRQERNFEYELWNYTSEARL